MRLRLAHDVDLDAICDLSYTVMRLLGLAAENRLALGKLEDGNQRFVLPGDARWEQLDMRVRFDRLLSLEDFLEPRSKRR